MLLGTYPYTKNIDLTKKYFYRCSKEKIVCWNLGNQIFPTRELYLNALVNTDFGLENITKHITALSNLNNVEIKLLHIAKCDYYDLRRSGREYTPSGVAARRLIFNHYSKLYAPLPMTKNQFAADMLAQYMHPHMKNVISMRDAEEVVPNLRSILSLDGELTPEQLYAIAKKAKCRAGELKQFGGIIISSEGDYGPYKYLFLADEGADISYEVLNPPESIFLNGMRAAAEGLENEFLSIAQDPRIHRPFDLLELDEFCVAHIADVQNADRFAKTYRPPDALEFFPEMVDPRIPGRIFCLYSHIPYQFAANLNSQTAASQPPTSQQSPASPQSSAGPSARVAGPQPSTSQQPPASSQPSAGPSARVVPPRSTTMTATDPRQTTMAAASSQTPAQTAATLRPRTQAASAQTAGATRRPTARTAASQPTFRVVTPPRSTPSQPPAMTAGASRPQPSGRVVASSLSGGGRVASALPPFVPPLPGAQQLQDDQILVDQVWQVGAAIGGRLVTSLNGIQTVYNFSAARPYSIIRMATADNGQQCPTMDEIYRMYTDINSRRLESVSLINAHNWRFTLHRAVEVFVVSIQAPANDDPNPPINQNGNQGVAPAVNPPNEPADEQNQNNVQPRRSSRKRKSGK